MKEVITSESVTSILDAKKIIDSISVINKKIEESKRTAESLIRNVSDSSKTLQKAKNDDSLTRRFLGWKSETLFDFIIESNNATHSSVSSISKLIQNNNDNSRLLAEMIGKLAMLSALSFEKNSEITAQLEELAINFEENSSNNLGQAGQIKRVILAHLNKIKEEKNKEDRIEFNFGVINENLKQLNEKLDVINIESEKKVAALEHSLGKRFQNERKLSLIQEHFNTNFNSNNNVENDSKSVLAPDFLNVKSLEHFTNTLDKQRKLIIGLAIFSLLTFLILIVFLIKYFYL